MAKRIINVPLQRGKPAPNPQFQDQVKQVGLDPNTVIAAVNEALRRYEGVPIQRVEVEVDEDTKRFKVLVTPAPIGDILLSILGRDTGGPGPSQVIGDVKLETVLKIAAVKYPELKSRRFTSAVKQVLSTCHAMGITVDKKPAREVIRLIDSGEYRELLEKYAKLAEEVAGVPVEV